ncbi:MAG: DUF1059 domain-containing protein [Candidatus Dojkabacteria bacterium]
MKKLTCNDLGGACDHILSGETFEEIGEASKAHAMEMVKKGDEPHMVAMEAMKNATPEEQQTMMAEYKRNFDAAPDSE